MSDSDVTLVGPDKVRAWAMARKLDVGQRGPIRNDVAAAFNKAHRKLAFQPKV